MTAAELTRPKATLVKGVYQLHSKSTGKDVAKSKLLVGFKTTFAELTV